MTTPRRDFRQVRHGVKLGGPQRMTSEDKTEINAVMEKISIAVDGVELHAMVEALAFFLIASVKTTYELSTRESVDFVAESIKRFGQTSMS